VIGRVRPGAVDPERATGGQKLPKPCLSPAPTGESRTYRSSPNPLNNLRGFSQQGTLYHSTIASALCPDPATTALATSGLVYAAEPAANDVVIAGNPFAFLR
jgi:hypothetical protein